jgi:hypothetical protein
MNADDDGFVSPQRIMKMLGATKDDLNVLLAKKFVIPFESGVVVIKHWQVNNLVRKDWYRPTVYQDEKRLLGLDKGKVYQLVESSLTKTHLLVNELVNVGNKLINKKDAENLALKKEEGEKSSEETKLEQSNKENEENIKKEMQKIRETLGIITAYMDETTAHLEPQEPQG